MYTFIEVLSCYVHFYGSVITICELYGMSSQYVHFHYCDSVHISNILDHIDHVFLTHRIIL